MEEIRLKRCCTCKIEKPLREFSKDSSRKDGLQPVCKNCQKIKRDANKEKTREYDKEYRLKNPEKLKERSKIYRENNKEKIRESKRKYEKENRDKIREYRQQFAEKNKEAIRERRAQYNLKNKELISDRKNRYYLENKDEILKKAKLHYENNKEVIKDRVKNYCELNRGKSNFIKAKYRAQKLQATPVWLTPEHFEEITEFYTICKLFQIYTGLTYHVDHVVPLQGKTVCGLHVPWNLQVLEASENISKNNKLLEN